MSEEEKEVIEYWKEKLKDYKKEINERQNDEFKGYGTSEDIAKLKYCNLHILLNLIENQQREKEIHIKLEQQYKKEYLDAKEENEKKDKIIDKYIAYIWKYDLNESKEWIKNYIENEWEEN